MNEEEKILVEKIAFLRYELVKTADAGQKFSLKKQIEEDEKRLQEIRSQKTENYTPPFKKTTTMAEQTEPKETENQDEKTPWYQNKKLMGGIATILGMAIIYAISNYGGAKKDEKPTNAVSTPMYSSYIVEGMALDQNNNPILNTKITVNNKFEDTDTQNGTFSIKGVKIGSDGKLYFYLKGEKLSKDTSQCQVTGNKIEILQALKFNLKKSDVITSTSSNLAKTNTSKPKTTYHSITLQGNADLVDYVLFDNNENNKIQPKNGIIKLPNLGTDFKNVKIYFKDTSKQNYDKDINNQVTEIGIN